MSLIKDGGISLSSDTKIRARQTHKGLAEHQTAYGYFNIIGSEMENYLFPDRRLFFFDLEKILPGLVEWSQRSGINIPARLSKGTQLPFLEPIPPSALIIRLLRHKGILSEDEAKSLFSEMNDFIGQELAMKVGPKAYKGGLGNLDNMIMLPPETAAFSSLEEIKYLKKDDDGRKQHTYNELQGFLSLDSLIHLHSITPNIYISIRRKAEEFLETKLLLHEKDEVRQFVEWAITKSGNTISNSDLENEKHSIDLIYNLQKRNLASANEIQLFNDIASSGDVFTYLESRFGGSIAYMLGLENNSTPEQIKAALQQKIIDDPTGFKEMLSHFAESLDRQQATTAEVVKESLRFDKEAYANTIADIALAGGLNKYLIKQHGKNLEGTRVTYRGAKGLIDSTSVILGVLEECDPQELGFSSANKQGHKPDTEQLKEWLATEQQRYQAIQSKERSLALLDVKLASVDDRDMDNIARLAIASKINRLYGQKLAYEHCREIGELGNHNEIKIAALSPGYASVAAQYENIVDGALDELGFTRGARTTPKGQSRHQHHSVHSQHGATYTEWNQPDYSSSPLYKLSDVNSNRNLTELGGTSKNSITFRDELCLEAQYVGHLLFPLLSQIPSTGNFSHEAKEWTHPSTCTGQFDRGKPIRNKYPDRNEFRVGDGTSYGYNRQALLLVAVQNVLERRGLAPIYIHPDYIPSVDPQIEGQPKLVEVFKEFTSSLIDKGVIPASLEGFHAVGAVEFMEHLGKLTNKQKEAIKSSGILEMDKLKTEIATFRLERNLPADPKLYFGPFPTQSSSEKVISPESDLSTRVDLARNNTAIPTSLREISSNWQSIPAQCPDLVHKLGPKFMASLGKDISAGVGQFTGRLGA